MTAIPPFAAPPPVQPAPITPIDPLDVEALVASIGLDAFTSKTFRKVHKHHVERATALREEVARKIHLFLNRTEQAETAPLPPFDFEQVAKDVEEPLDPQHVEREVAAFGPAHDMAIQVNLAVQRLKTYVAGKIPKRIYHSLAGPEPSEPPRSEIARFRRLWVIACDPLSILDDLNEYAVSRDQVSAIADMFPGIWGLFWPVTQEQLVRRAGASKGTYRLSRRKENLLRVLVKQEAANKPLVQACQQIFDEQDAALAGAKNPAQPVGKSPSTDSDDANTQATQAQQLQGA